MEINIFTGIAEIYMQDTPHFMGDYFVYKYSSNGRDGDEFGFFVMRRVNLALAYEIEKLGNEEQRGRLILLDGKNYLVDLTLIWDVSELDLGNVRFRFEFAPGTEKF